MKKQDLKKKKKAYPHLSTKTSIVSFNNSLGKYTQSFLKSLFDEKLSCYDKVRELVSQRDTSMWNAPNTDI